MMDWVWDGLTWIIWMATEGMISFTDMLWNGVFALTKEQTMINILNLEPFAKALTFTMAIGGAMIMLALCTVAIKNMIELDGQANTIFYKRAIFAVVWMTLSVATLTYFVPIAGYLTQAATSIISVDNSSSEELYLSRNIASTLLAESTVHPARFKPVIYSEIEAGTFRDTVNLRCQDRAELCPDDADKKAHIFDIGTIFTTLIIVFAVGALSFVIGIQVARRLLELVVLKIIAPLCASSWVTDQQAQRARQWQKMATGALLATSGQVLSISIGTVVISQMNVIIQGTGGASTYAYILLVVGVIMFVIFTPATINALVDGETSTMEGIKALAAMKTGADVAKGAMKAAGSVAAVGMSAIGAAGGAVAGGARKLADAAGSGANMASKMSTGMGLSQLSASAKTFNDGGSPLGGSQNNSTPSGGGSESTGNNTIGESQANYSGSGSSQTSGGAMNAPMGAIPSAIHSARGFAQSVSNGTAIPNAMRGMNNAATRAGNAIANTPSSIKGVATRVGKSVSNSTPVQTANYAASLMYAQSQFKPSQSSEGASIGGANTQK